MPWMFWGALHTSVYLCENTECFQNDFIMKLSMIFLEKMLPHANAGIRVGHSKILHSVMEICCCICTALSSFLLSVILFLSLLLEALCTSTGPGTATCQCNTGWTGDGKACVAINNCMLESRGNCHINADCVYIGPGQVWAMLSSLMGDLTFPKLLWDGLRLPEV